MIGTLSRSQSLILTFLTHLLHHLSQYTSYTKMCPLGLSIVLAPTLIKGPNPLEDAALCLEQGKSLPAAMLEMAREQEVQVGPGGTVVGVIDMWVRNWPALSGAKKLKGESCGCSWIYGGHSRVRPGHSTRVSDTSSAMAGQSRFYEHED